MSDQIKHECGLAFIRLRQPLSYYTEKYGTALYGLKKLQVLLQKQRNRGQDGAGIATIKLDTPPGNRYISRKRNNSDQCLSELIKNVQGYYDGLTPEQLLDAEWMKANRPFTGELLMGHLRYGTHGRNSIEQVHPFLRMNNWKTRNLVMAGNFNLTNVDELFEELIGFGQHPKERSDTVTVMEKIGHFLDDEVQRLFNWFKPEGYDNQEINALIAEHLDVQRVLRRATRQFDGGYVMAGMIGHGDAFVLRDPHGIRPAYYYYDDEIIVVASEKPAIQTAINVRYNEVQELKRGHALIVKYNGAVNEVSINEQEDRKACSFERIYFSRGNDRDIYTERKQLGKLLVPKVLETINNDLENTVFSFIPNTAEVAFFGMIDGLQEHTNDIKKQKLLEQKSKLNENELDKILSLKPRIEKLAIKDAKMRTFIASDANRGEMVSLVYDVTYGIVKNHVDTLVLIDDSIVRGTTLKDKILQILSRLKPKKIIIVSSAPQIRYPDCYGIDMSRMKEFVAFRALVSLLEEEGKQQLIMETYECCKAQLELPRAEMRNCVKDLYAHYTQEQISKRITKLLTPSNINIEIEIIYQNIENLHLACPNHLGDWYFSGNYPTPGGNIVANKAFVNFVEKKDVRAYA